MVAPQWWTPARIEATVTRQFVENNLLPEERDRLDRARPDRTRLGQAVGEGPGLALDSLPTTYTYWDWIRARARRLFLILVDLDITDQIFGLADDAWSDNDLPISPKDVTALSLTPKRDEQLERRFFQRQYHYIVKLLLRGEHRAFADPEVVPVEVVDRPSALNRRGQVADRVRLPNEPGRLFCRRKIQLGDGSGLVSEADFFQAVASARAQQNDHVVSYWASYAHQGATYVLFGPASDLNLKSFLSGAPTYFKSLPKKGRRELVMNWILCLVDTVCALHLRGRSHGCIKPTNVLLNSRNHIFFADSSRLSPESWTTRAEKTSFDREWYDYAAPEQWFRPASGPAGPSGRRPSVPGEGAFGILGSSDRHPSSPSMMLQTPNPDLDPQPADIFSLGCIILELLTFLVKRTPQKFAAYRSQRRKSAGRGGAVGDTSIHKNLTQVEGWMSEIARDAAAMGAKKSAAEGGNVFAGVTPMLHIVTSMLAGTPADRPPAHDVQRRVYQVVAQVCGIAEPHCVHQYDEYGGVERSMNRLRIGDTSAASMYMQQSIMAGAPTGVTPGPTSPTYPSPAYPMPNYPPYSDTVRSNSSGAQSTLSSSVASSDHVPEPLAGGSPRPRPGDLSPPVMRERTYSSGLGAPRNIASRASRGPLQGP